MEYKVIQGVILDVKADTIVVNLFEGVGEPEGTTGSIDGALNGMLRDLIASGDITGKLGEVSLASLLSSVIALPAAWSCGKSQNCCPGNLRANFFTAVPNKPPWIYSH